MPRDEMQRELREQYVRENALPHGWGPGPFRKDGPPRGGLDERGRRPPRGEEFGRPPARPFGFGRPGDDEPRRREFGPGERNPERRSPPRGDPQRREEPPRRDQ
jgi:hypothetical protein